MKALRSRINTISGYVLPLVLACLAGACASLDNLYQSQVMLAPMVSKPEAEPPGTIQVASVDLQTPLTSVRSATWIISLDEVLDQALDVNLDLALARAEEAVARMQLRVEEGKFYPSLEFGAQVGHQDGQVQGSFGDLRDIDVSRFDQQWGVVYRINIGQQIYNTIAFSRKIDQSILNTLDVKQHLLLRVYGLYQNLLLAKTGVTIAEQLVQDSELFVRIATTREVSGVGLGAETARAKAKLASDKRELIGAVKLWEMVSVALAVVLRWEHEGLLEPAELQLNPTRLVSESDLGEAARSALLRPDVQQVQQELEALSHRFSAAKWDLFGPYVQLQARENFVGDGFKNIDDRTDLGAFLVWSFSLDRLRRLDQIRAEQAVASLHLAQLKERAVGEVESLKKEIRAAYDQIPLVGEELNAAEETLRISQSRYRAGTAIALEVLDAEDALAQARLDLAISIVDYNLSQVKLMSAAGIITRDVF